MISIIITILIHNHNNHNTNYNNNHNNPQTTHDNPDTNRINSKDDLISIAMISMLIKNLRLTILTIILF